MFKTVKQSIRVDMMMTKSIIEKYHTKRRKEILAGWKLYMSDVRAKKLRVGKMIQAFKRFHLRPVFERLRGRASPQRKTLPMTGNQAAALKFEDLKDKFRGMDKALQMIYQDKASKEDFESLKSSVNQHRTLSVFNDVRQLFEVSIEDVKGTLEKEKQSLREAF
jgi:hypothetical protein